MRGRKERIVTKEQPHNATQCHLQMNGCIILTSCHVPCIPSCEEKGRHSSQQYIEAWIRHILFEGWGSPPEVGARQASS